MRLTRILCQLQRLSSLDFCTISLPRMAFSRFTRKKMAATFHDVSEIPDIKFVGTELVVFRCPFLEASGLWELPHPGFQCQIKVWVGISY